MQVRCAALFSIVFAAFVAAPSVLAAAQNDASPGVSDIEVRTTTASSSEFRRATPLTQYLQGDSRTEPDVCEEDGALIDAPVTNQTNATRADGAFVVSPASISVAGLVPSTTYRACMAVSNFARDTTQFTVDDVDLAAAEGTEDGIDIIDDAQTVGSWIVPLERTFTIRSGEQRIVPYVIRTPAALPAGTVTGGIRVVARPRGGVQAGINQRIYISSPGGTRGELEIEDLDSTRLITGEAGAAAFRIRGRLRNQSDYLETYVASAKLGIFGWNVRTYTGDKGAFLPDGVGRLQIADKDTPWIGIYRPTLLIETSSGRIERTLPWLLILPPTPYLIALIIAIVLPTGYLLWRWHRRRQEWLMYLMEELEREERGEGAHEGEHDDYWDPMRQP